MERIKLTLRSGKKPVYINVDCIGHFFEVPEERRGDSIVEIRHTNVGVTTHNNGGFSVLETCEEINKLISEIKLEFFRLSFILNFICYS